MAELEFRNRAFLKRKELEPSAAPDPHVANALRAWNAYRQLLATLELANGELMEAKERERLATSEAIRAFEHDLAEAAQGRARELQAKIDRAKAAGLEYGRLALVLPPNTGALAASVRLAEPPAEDMTGDPCSRLIDKPFIGIDPRTCKRDAVSRSLASRPGGQVEVPGSFLSPPGFSTSINASSDDSSISVAYAPSYLVRRVTKAGTPGVDRIQRPYAWGYSVGLKAGSGTLFNSDSGRGSVDGLQDDAALVLGLSVDFMARENESKWNIRAKRLRDAARTACRQDNASANPKFRSTCIGLALTDWVYAVDDTGKLINASFAKQADQLYFGSESNIPAFGFGLLGEVGHASFDFLPPENFAPNFVARFDDAFEAAALRTRRAVTWSLTGYGYARITDPKETIGIALVPSFTRSRRFATPGEETLFCPEVTTVFFSTEGCGSYLASPPKLTSRWTPSVETRMTLDYGPGFVVAPSIAYDLVDDSEADRWRFKVPILVFVDGSKSSAVGITFGLETGGAKDGQDLDDVTTVALSFSKNFSLTGK